MTNIRRIALTSVLVLSTSFAFAQTPRRPSLPSMPQKRTMTSADESSKLTYDLSASSGSYNGVSYTEITLGLNWWLSDWFNWRNSVFTRQGSGMQSVQGLDTSARFMTSIRNDSGSVGLDAFAGPGLRFASESSNAVFAEAGVIVKLGGLRIGVGGKALNYIADRDDATGSKLPKNDSQVFIILSGGGSL